MPRPCLPLLLAAGLVAGDVLLALQPDSVPTPEEHDPHAANAHVSKKPEEGKASATIGSNAQATAKPLYCARKGNIMPSRKVIWSYWDDEVVPDDVGVITSSWKLWAPAYEVRVLNRATVWCYLPDIDVTSTLDLQLRTDVIRLNLLHRYGGVWLDAGVVLTSGIDTHVGQKGFRATAIPSHQKHGHADFVESWFLAADAGDYIIGTWKDALQEAVTANGGRVDNISKSNPQLYNAYTMAPLLALESELPRSKVGEKSEQGARAWGEYLVVYVVFTHLYQTDPQFQARVRQSVILDSSKVGYFLQLANGWNRTATKAVLQARWGSLPQHEALQRGGLIKLSSADRLPILLPLINDRDYRNTSEAEMPFIMRMLRLCPNLHGLRRDKFQLVVAQYTEDLTWTHPYQGVRRIYSKSLRAPALKNQFFDHSSALPNVGREAHTYLSYVLENWDALPEYVGFAQGAQEADRNWIRADYGPLMYISMLREAKSNAWLGCSAPLLADANAPGSDWGWEFNISNLMDSAGGMEHYGDETDAETGPHLQHSNFVHNLRDWFDAYEMKAEDDGNLRFYPDGLFVVSRDRIHSRQRAFYEAILEHAVGDQPLAAHYLERSWYYVFNCGGDQALSLHTTVTIHEEDAEGSDVGSG